MRLDHIAYRTADRKESAKFFQDCLHYTIGTEFDLKFDDGTVTDCIALLPPEDRAVDANHWRLIVGDMDQRAELHGPEGSIVGDWVAAREGVGGVHHIAYEVEGVAPVMREWKSRGYAEFYSEEPLICEETNLEQVFTKPSKLTGIIYELISRGQDNKGFCQANIKGLMESTRGE